MSSGDCYDPETNTWSQMANMNIARRGHSLVTVHGRLYAIGGCHRDGFADGDSVEVYDPNNQIWTLLQNKLDGEVTDAGVCFVRKFMII